MLKRVPSTWRMSPGSTISAETARVDALEYGAGERPLGRLEIPPGDAVLRPDHRAARRQRRAEAGGDRRQAVGLQRHQDDLGARHRLLEVAARRRAGGEVAVGGEDAHAV
jgi:hypothetical protein